MIYTDLEQENKFKKQLLLVEDNPGDAEIIRVRLEDDYEITHAYTLKDALEQLDTREFDIILLDMMLPDSNGDETIGSVKKVVPNHPLVVLTGFSDTDSGIKAMRMGAQDFLIKDEVINTNLLKRVLRYACERQGFLQKIKRSETTLKQAHQMVQMGVLEWNSHLGTIRESEEVQEIFQISNNDQPFSEEDWIKRFHKEDRADVKLILQQAKSSELPIHFQVRALTPGKDVLDLLIKGQYQQGRSKAESVYMMVIQDVTSTRKQLEDIQIKAKLLENVADAAIAIDRAGKVIYWNKSAEKLYKYSNEQAVGERLSNLEISDESSEVENYIASSLTGKTIFSGTYAMKNRSGDRFTVWVTNTPVRDENDEIIAYLSISRDITKELNNKRLLEASEEKFRQMFEYSPTGKALGDFNSGRYIDANQAFLDLLGFSKTELERMSFNDITPAKYAKLDEAAGVQLKEVGYYAPYRKEYIRKDGTPVSVIVSGFLAEGENSKKLFWTLVVDLSELEKQTEALREIEERFRTYINDANDVVFTTEINGNFSYFSPNIEQLLGYSSEELIGKDCKDFVHPDDVNVMLETLQNARSKIGVSQSITFRARHKDGRYLWNNSSMLVRRSVSGNKYAIGIIRDIDKERRAEIQILEQNKRLKEIAFVQSHILRRPLANILGMLSLPTLSENIPSDSKRYLEIILSEAETMDKIVAEIVDKTAQVKKMPVPKNSAHDNVDYNSEKE